MRITPRCPGPDRCSCVHCEGDDVYRSPTVLYDQRHPDQVAEPLHQSRGGEEVGRPGEIRREVLLPQGVFVAAEEGIGGFYDSDARPGAEEVARCHGETEERGDVGAVGFGPVEGIVRIIAGLRDEDEGLRSCVLKPDAALSVEVEVVVIVLAISIMLR